jgi:hypothetical protein
VQVLDGRTMQKGPRFDAFDLATPQGPDRGFRGGVTVAVGVLDASGLARIVAGADAGDNSPNDAPVLRVLDGSGAVLRDYVAAFESSYHGGVNVAIRRGRVLAAPARPHAAVVDVFDTAFTQPPPSFAVADANFANGFSLGG